MNKTISLELAKKISEAAKEKGVVLPESEMVWAEMDRWSVELFPAYDCAELGEILPANFLNEINIEESSPKRCFHEFLSSDYVEDEAEARGEMYLYLVQNGYIK